MAFLQGSSENGTWNCDATAISPNVVLTAAHCVVDPFSDQFVDSAGLRLVFGTDDPRSAIANHTATFNTVVRYVTPHDYGVYDSGAVTHDVALLQTSEPVSGTVPILPPDRADLLRPGTRTTVMGWGRTDDSDPDSHPATIVAAPMTLQPHRACSSHIEGYDPFVMLCSVKDDGAAPCYGDSGGPLLVDDRSSGVSYQIGVVSFGGECEIAGSGSVFASVAGPALNGFVTTQARRLQEAADAADAGQLITADSSSPPSSPVSLSFRRARSTARSYAARHWSWTITSVRCARRSTAAITCRVDGRRAGRGFFSRMLVMVDAARRTHVSGMR